MNDERVHVLVLMIAHVLCEELAIPTDMLYMAVMDQYSCTEFADALLVLEWSGMARQSGSILLWREPERYQHVGEVTF